MNRLEGDKSPDYIKMLVYFEIYQRIWVLT